MHGVTRQALTELRSMDWFGDVGHRIPVEGRPVPIWVDSWRTAGQVALTVESQNARIEWANSLRDAVRVVSYQARQCWNGLADGVRPFVDRLCLDVIVPVGKGKGIPGLGLARLSEIITKRSKAKAIIDSVKWDILHYLMELEYSDIVELGYFHEEMEWYRVGHFPCGWEGEWPAGSRVVY